MKQLTRTSRLKNFISSQLFFILVVASLVVQALWIALSAKYPMAFDEEFHLGVIRIYAHNISPFISSQPAGADTFGPVARDPSYLYHYLMSLPFHIITFFTSSQTIQILLIRFINIALFASGLPVLRRLLLKSGASRVITHLTLAVLVFIPMVPFLAAQINYDNLFLPLVALSLLLTLRYAGDLSQERSINVKYLLQLFIILLLTSCVKYAFLPILLSIVIFISLKTYLVIGRHNLLQSLQNGIKCISRSLLCLLLIGFIIGIVLFLQRDGINILRYHKAVPACDEVLTTQQCHAYGPWERDYILSLGKVTSNRSPIYYVDDWFYGMWLRSFFALDGPSSQFQTRGPMLMPGISVIVLAGVGFILLIANSKRIYARYDKSFLQLSSIVTFLYIAALYVEEYKAFLHTGQPVAINGRYLLPVLPIIILMVSLAYKESLQSRKRLAMLVGASALICLVWGGGALTYVLRSNDTWYWPNSTVRNVNHAVQNILGPVTPGYYNQTQFLK